LGFLEDTLNNVGEEYKGGKGFEKGTHVVTILAADAGDSKDRPILKVTVGDPEDTDKTAEATLWFHTEGGAKMAVTKVLGILIHSVGEEKKEKVRQLGKQLFGAIEKPEKARDVAAKLINDKLIGKEAYLVVDPQGKYSTSKYGDIWHYPAEIQDGEKKVKVGDMEGTEVAADDIPDFDEV